jgi:hypothetical protein
MTEISRCKLLTVNSTRYVEHEHASLSSGIPGSLPLLHCDYGWKLFAVSEVLFYQKHVSMLRWKLNGFMLSCGIVLHYRIM